MAAAGDVRTTETPSEDAPEGQPSSEEEEHATTERYLCVKQAQARAAVSMDSEKSGKVEVDEVVEVLQKVDIEDEDEGFSYEQIFHDYGDGDADDEENTVTYWTEGMSIVRHRDEATGRWVYECVHDW